MKLNSKQINIIAESIGISDVLKYVEEHKVEYKQFLLEKLKYKNKNNNYNKKFKSKV